MLSSDNKRDLIESYLKSWGNNCSEVEYYLNIPNWEENFSYLWDNLDIDLT